MVNSVFNNINGKNTVFHTLPHHTLPHHAFTQHASIQHILSHYNPPVLPTPEIYDFNKKIKYITTTLNHIVYYDFDVSNAAIKKEYNIILNELHNIKKSNDTHVKYNILIHNIITTFETVYNLLTKYISRTELEFELPSMTYSHINGLKNFIQLLHNEGVPDEQISVVNEELENVLFNLYKNVGSDLEVLLNLYSTGKFEQLHTELTYEVYSKLSIALFEESYETSIGYSRVFSAIQSSLEGLYKSVLMEDSYKLEIDRLKATIELYKDKQSNTSALSTSATVETIAIVRPEIMEYIRLYGFPCGAVFETDKLSTIINNLGL